MVTLRSHTPSTWKQALALGLVFLLITACSSPKKDSLMFGGSNYNSGFGSLSDPVFGSPGTVSIMEH